jgi:hypothetical protein
MRPVVERTSREPDDAAGTTAAKLSSRRRIDAVIRQARREQPEAGDDEPRARSRTVATASRL